MTEQTKRDLKFAGAGAAILVVMVIFVPRSDYEPGSGSTGSTGINVTTYASGAAEIRPLLAMPEAVVEDPPECPSTSPRLSTSDGLVTCCVASHVTGRSTGGPNPVYRLLWDCPSGWRVLSGQVVPWVTP